MIRRYPSTNEALDACGDGQRVVVFDGRPYVASESLVDDLEAHGAAVQIAAFDGHPIWHVESALA